MKFRTKILFLFILLSLTSNGILFSIMYINSKNIVYRQIQSKVLTVAATIASFIDGDTHKEIKTREDEKSVFYNSIINQLRDAREANRRDDIYVQYVYTMTTSPDNSDVIIFGVDAEESFENKSHVGDVYKGKYDSPLKIDEYQVDNSFTNDQWGLWLSANAPIRDSKGRAVASLGVDVSAKDVVDKLNNIYLYGLEALGGSLAFAVILAAILSRRVSRPLSDMQKVLHSIGSGNLDVSMPTYSNDEFGDAGRAINGMINGLRERDTIRRLFKQHVSASVADNILWAEGMTGQKTERKRVTVLFSDIRGFTSFSEKMNPEEVVELLNEYFDTMVDIVYKHHGEAYKFIGDGMMVVFGAPVEDEFQEEHAIDTALDMKKELFSLCSRWKQEGRTEIRIGIGINSGTVVVGNIGSKKRTEYTVIGDTVNLASRIETLTKELDEDIIMSEYTYTTVKHLYKTRKIGPSSIKGKDEPVNLYAVYDKKR